MLIPAIVTWTDEDTGEIHTSKIIGEVDVYAAHPADQSPSERDCASGWFWEWGINLFGWNLTVAVSVDARPSRWGLFCQWLHKDRAEMPRGWVWHCSLAAMTLCVGPVAVDVSVLRL